MTQTRIHLIAPAGSCGPFLSRIGVDSPAELVTLVAKSIGAGYDVTANDKLIAVEEDELHGGRRDDAERAADIEEALGDSDVAAVIMLRGGAWFTRVLPRIDFSVLDRRTTRVALFGFSELTPLVNIVAAHPNGLGFYDMGPVFLGYGLKRHAEIHGDKTLTDSQTPRDWMLGQLPDRFRAFFRRCAETLAGRRSIEIDARLVRGDLPDAFDVTFVGGNLTVLSTMIGSIYESSIAPRGHWLLLEDYNDKPERFDRYLSHLTLAGYWDQCDGLLLGDFHQGDRDLHDAILEMLRFHARRDRPLPILHAPTIGHTCPMDTLPLHAPAAARRVHGDNYSLAWTIAGSRSP